MPGRNADATAITRLKEGREAGAENGMAGADQADTVIPKEETVMATITPAGMGVTAAGIVIPNGITGVMAITITTIMIIIGVTTTTGIIMAGTVTEVADAAIERIGNPGSSLYEQVVC